MGRLRGVQNRAESSRAMYMTSQLVGICEQQASRGPCRAGGTDPSGIAANCPAVAAAAVAAAVQQTEIRRLPPLEARRRHPPSHSSLISPSLASSVWHGLSAEPQKAWLSRSL